MIKGFFIHNKYVTINLLIVLIYYILLCSFTYNVQCTCAIRTEAKNLPYLSYSICRRCVHDVGLGPRHLPGPIRGPG